MNAVLDAVTGNPAYVAAIVFLGVYPVLGALYWIAGSLVFAARRERHDGSFYDIDEHPFVSVIVAARNEEAVIEGTLDGLFQLDWPAYEIVVVDDGSTDRTGEILARHAQAGRIRLVSKRRNEGKAMALNDALPLLKGEIILLVDADGRPEPDVLRWLVPHFVRVPRLAGVTGNPRVANTTTLLAKLQALEFTATVSVLRRAQTSWGRIMTISGVSTALRRSAVEAVGRFQPQMATEDIALTWQLQRDFHDVRYEPRALFAMQVPEGFGAWWRQRVRWARGLGQVLRRDAGIFRSWKRRRLWPLYIEATLSAVWSHLFVVLAGVWITAYAAGAAEIGADPIPNYWGMLMASVCMLQIVVGIALDARHDRPISRYVLWLPLYPLLYWMLTALASVRGTLAGVLRRPSGPVTWTQARYPEADRAG